MKVWVSVCCAKGCGIRFGCKFYNEYNSLEVRSCEKCLFSYFDKECMGENVEIIESHGLCKNHLNEAIDELNKRRNR